MMRTLRGCWRCFGCFILHTKPLRLHALFELISEACGGPHCLDSLIGRISSKCVRFEGHQASLANGGGVSKYTSSGVWLSRD